VHAQIVGLYPGVAYPPLHHRDIPGYPLVARTNSYLYARYDGTVLDGKPWGHGEVDGEEVGNKAAGPGWPAGAHNVAETALSKLEVRGNLLHLSGVGT
jgi:hypothetical protein